MWCKSSKNWFSRGVNLLSIGFHIAIKLIVFLKHIAVFFNKDKDRVEFPSIFSTWYFPFLCYVMTPAAMSAGLKDNVPAFVYNNAYLFYDLVDLK